MPPFGIFDRIPYALRMLCTSSYLVPNLLEINLRENCDGVYVGLGTSVDRPGQLLQGWPAFESTVQAALQR